MGKQKFTKDISVTLFPYIGIILSSIMDGKNQSAWQVVHARVCREDWKCGDSSKQCVYRLILHFGTFHLINWIFEVFFTWVISNIICLNVLKFFVISTVLTRRYVMHNSKVIFNRHWWWYLHWNFYLFCHYTLCILLHNFWCWLGRSKSLNYI